MKIKKNDIVKIITGKDAGKTGKVLRVLNSEGKVVVEGINVAKKHVKPSGNNKEGGVIKKELPISVSNIMYMDNDLGRPVRLGSKIVDGKKYRLNKVTKEVIEK